MPERRTVLSAAASSLMLTTVEAGQFAIGAHALCWVHAERLVHKLDAFTDQQRLAQQQIRTLIWKFYADLKAYRVRSRSTPAPGAARAVRPHLPPSHRLCHARSPAGTTVGQQGGPAEGAGSSRGAAAYQWI